MSDGQRDRSEQNGCGTIATTALVAGLVAAATVLQLARTAAVSGWDTVWAEDGVVFLVDALEMPLLRALIDPYGGYLHAPSRLLAEGAAAIPLEHAALLLALGSALVVSLVAAFVYFASATAIRSVPLRLTLSALVVLLPAAGSELLTNVTNLHFFLMFGCFWALVWQSEATGALATRSLVVAATALADPLAAIYLPLAVWIAGRRASSRGLVVPIVLAGALLVQGAATLAAGDRPDRLTRFDASDLPLLFALRVAGSLLVGDRFLDELWFELGRLFAYLSLILVAFVLALGAARLDRRRRRFVATCCVYALGLFTVYLVGRGSAGMRPGTDPATWHLAGARYTLVPILLLVSALLVEVDSATGARARRALEGAAVAIAVALMAANFSLSSERSLGPHWRPELAEARARCNDGGSDPVEILVAPAPFGFHLSSTCDSIR